MASFAPIRGTRTQIGATPMVDGQFLVETDQGNKNKIYLDSYDSSHNLMRTICGGGERGMQNHFIITSDDTSVSITCTLPSGSIINCTQVSGSTTEWECETDEYGIHVFNASVGGNTYTKSLNIVKVGEYTFNLYTKINLESWLIAGGLNPDDYSTFAEVEADEKAIRRLMTIHASVDYLASCDNASDTFVNSVISSDICAKWINLRDYALETLYANTYVATMMDTTDKYFYGEWCIIDDTTTPATWGAKGCVPIMSRDAMTPYGYAIASSASSSGASWKAFNGTNNGEYDGWTGGDAGSTGWIGYIFPAPVKVKKVYFENRIFSDENCRIKTYKIQGSNDVKFNGTDGTWVNLTDSIIRDDSKDASGADETCFIPTANQGYYRAYRVYIENVFHNYVGVGELQFYGREMKPIVIPMTGNDAPYGHATAVNTSSELGTNYWRGFRCRPDLSGDRAGWWGIDGQLGSVTYESPLPMCVKAMKYENTHDGASYWTKKTDFEASVDGTEGSFVTLAADIIGAAIANGVFYTDFNNSTDYRFFRLNGKEIGNRLLVYANMQFYGFDYSEYDWDANYPRVFITDHGLDIATISNFKSASDAIIERESSQIYLKGSQLSTGNGNISEVYSGIDFVNNSYDNIVMRLGSKATVSGAQGDGDSNMSGGLWTPTTPNSSDMSVIYNSSLGTLNINIGNYATGDYAIDSSAFNQFAYVAVITGYWANRSISVSELFLF